MMALGVTLTTGCQPKPQAALGSGIYLENLDTTVARGADFYDYACGGWMKNNPLTDEYSRFGSFDRLAENNREQLKELITGLAAATHEQGTVAQKIADIYNLAMNTEKLNAEGSQPIQADLARIAELKDKSEIIPMMTQLYYSGAHPYFVYYVGADVKESETNIFQLYQGGMGLGRKGYYLDMDEATVAIREAYKVHVAKMFQLAGFDAATATKSMEAVMEIETRLAKAAYGPVELREPSANYHKMSVEELKSTFAGINWDDFFGGLELHDITSLNVSQLTAIHEVEKLLKEVDLTKHIAYMQWKLIDGAASYLSEAFVAQNFDFYGKTLSGKQEDQPRWKHAVGAVDGMLGQAVGQMYVEKYFPPAAKDRMIQLVENLQVALGERIQALEWMSDSTKVKAMEKLGTFYVKVGYPDTWRDYSDLSIEQDSYYANVKRAIAFEMAYKLGKVGTPVDKEEWGMTPQTVNAYYRSTTNEICFPAGILQYPFFDMNADDAFNYGAIGMVIGHEMTHGFDDKGRQFDKEGNLKDWWTADDATRFDQRAEVMVNFFDKIEVLPGLNVNGKLTLGENIADNGGLQVAYQAYKNATQNKPLEVKEGFTADQRFFLAYAGVWAGNIREEQMRLQTMTGPHSLGRWRVNGALPHIDAWYEAFGIKEGDPMYVAPEDRVSIW